MWIRPWHRVVWITPKAFELRFGNAKDGFCQRMRFCNDISTYLTLTVMAVTLTAHPPNRNRDEMSSPDEEEELNHFS